MQTQAVTKGMKKEFLFFLHLYLCLRLDFTLTCEPGQCQMQTHGKYDSLVRHLVKML